MAAGKVVVLPAFETRDESEAGREQTRQVVRQGKPAAVALLNSGQLIQFHLHIYQAGHAATDSKKWARTDEAYTVKYKEVRHGLEFSVQADGFRVLGFRVRLEGCTGQGAAVAPRPLGPWRAPS